MWEDVLANFAQVVSVVFLCLVAECGSREVGVAACTWKDAVAVDNDLQWGSSVVGSDARNDCWVVIQVQVVGRKGFVG